MLKWTASAQRLNELATPVRPNQRRQRHQRRATIATNSHENKENLPNVGYTSTPVPLRNSPLVLAPLTDVRNITPETFKPSPRQRVRHVYATTLPHYAEEYSPNAAGQLPTGQHLALRGLLPMDPFLEQPRYMDGSATLRQLTKRKLEPDFADTTKEEVIPVVTERTKRRPSTPQPASAHMDDQSLDKLIDAILDSACKADATTKHKKPRKSFNLRRRTLVKQQLESEYAAILSPSYAPGDDPASDLSFGMLPCLPTTPEPASPLPNQLPHSLLVQLPTPQLRTRTKLEPKTSLVDNTFCLETPVRKLKRSRDNRQTMDQGQMESSPLKRYKVDARNYFEVGLALPSSIYV
ncbi:uncharacterized protein [Drosophila tropicalis]|uniref:uncharacterized protein n=1 Tax=Drosophila tropicalis TaxID=46794 RepID=UPI0035ABA90B